MRNERDVNEVRGIVKQSGTGAHIMLPRDWIGIMVKVIRLYTPIKEVNKK